MESPIILQTNRLKLYYGALDVYKRQAPAVPGRCGGGGGPPFLFPWRRGFYCAVPVSYTHLDVYKRQLIDKNQHLKCMVFRKDYDSHKENVNELLDKNKMCIRDRCACASAR